MTGLASEQTCARCLDRTVCSFSGARWLCAVCWPLVFGQSHASNGNELTDADLERLAAEDGDVA